MRTLLVMVLCFGFASVVLADWVPLGPVGGNLYSMAVAPSNQNIIYVCPGSSPASVQKSIDGGNTWNRVGSVTYYLYSMAVDPTNTDIVYGTSFSYIHKSTNGGVTWSNTYLTNTYTYAVAVHPTTPATVLATGYTYTGTNWVMCFCKTTNGGGNWTTVQLDTASGCGYSLAIDPSNPNTIYVGGYSSSVTTTPKVFKSTNGGTSFSDVSSGLAATSYYVYSLAVHPTNPNIVLAGTYYGIFRSTSGGGAWTSTASYYYIYSLSPCRSSPDIAFAGGYYADIYKTTNGGSTWFISGTGMTGGYARGVAVHQTQPSIVYAANNTGFFKTTNGGTNWYPSISGMYAASITTLALARSQPSTIYIENGGIGVYKSTNAGSNWSKCSDFLSCGNICGIGVHNTDPNTVIALEGSG